jgi:hypothetical protein
MTTTFRFAVLVVTVFAVGCGSGEPPAEAAAAAPAEAAPAAAAPGRPAGAPAKKSTPESRADEIIADLQRRQNEQSKIQKEAAERVAVVTEISPKSAPGRGGFGRLPNNSGTYATSAPPPGGGGASNDADYWRQEFGIASARLQATQQTLTQAKQKMTDAESQMRNPNQAVARSGREAYSRAQQEYSAAQSALYQHQSAVDAARNNAIRAGVPASYLR